MHRSSESLDYFKVSKICGHKRHVYDKRDASGKFFAESNEKITLKYVGTSESAR